MAELLPIGPAAPGDVIREDVGTIEYGATTGPRSSAPVVTGPRIIDPLASITPTAVTRGTELLAVPRAGGAWGPYVELVARNFPGVQFTVWRSWADRKTKVRPLVETFAGPDSAIRDYEAPLDVPITYTLEDLASRVHATKTVTLASTSDMGWIHPVLDPSLAVQVEWNQRSFSTMIRPTTGTPLYVQGSSDPVVVNGGIRRGMTNMPLVFRVYSRDQEAKVERMLGARSEPGMIRRAPTAFCVRTSGIVPLSGSTIVAMPELALDRTENRSRYFFTEYSGNATEITPPAPGRRVDRLTYDVFQKRFSTYDEFKAKYPTYADAQVDYSGVEA